MTNEEINTTIAARLGWVEEKCLYDYMGESGVASTWKLYDKGGKVIMLGILDYTKSRDACATFESTLTDPVDRENYIAALIRIVLSGDEKLVYTVAFDIVTATPLQRCQAYLNVKGLWK